MTAWSQNRVGPPTGRRPSHASACILLVALYITAACDARSEASRQLSGDTLVVWSPEPKYSIGRLREVFSVGAIDGPDEYVFTEIIMFTIGPSAELYIADIERDVRMFDPSGRFVRRVGRIGKGPGETQFVVGMDVSNDGRLAVLDLGNHRVSVWSADGELLNEMSRPPTRVRYGRDAIAFDDAGEIWVGLGQPLARPDQAPGPRPIFARLTGDGIALDTILLDPGSNDCVPRNPARGRGYWEDTMERFLPMVKWTRGRDGRLAFGCPARYEIDVVRPEGHMKTGRAWTPARTAAGEKDFFTQLAPGRQIPDTKPAFHRLWLTEDGRIWAWRGRPGRIVDSPHLVATGGPAQIWEDYSPTDGFDVFEQDGRWLGVVETPVTWAARPMPGHKDPYIRGDTVWAVTLDEWGAHYVKRFVVEWEP